MIRKVNLLTFITAFAFLLVSIGKGTAFQDMTCKSRLSTGEKPIKCITFKIDEGRTRIACGGQPLEKDSDRIYNCSLVVRGHGSSAPYAHTSTVWQCVSNDLRKYLFDQDFITDAVRCNLVCGRCEGNWEASAFPH